MEGTFAFSPSRRGGSNEPQAEIQGQETAELVLSALTLTKSAFSPQLAGPVPLLPDYAYGTWWTWWIAYTEAQAKSYLQSWEDNRL